MSIIYSQQFIITTRSIDLGQQHYTDTEQFIDLYEDKIITPLKKFLLYQVFDVSYKSLSDESGFLYLHTNQGVFPFKVNSSPHRFIEEYHKLK